MNLFDLSKFLLIITLFHQSSLATPQNIEVWFIKEKVYHSFIPSRLNNQTLLSSLYSSNFIGTSHQQCTPYDQDNYFSPQLGLHSHFKTGDKYISPQTFNSFEDFDGDNKEFRYFSNEETKKIKCDKNNFFDIFCGKASKSEQQNKDFEVWIDISSSLRPVDPISNQGTCYRQLFVQKLRDECLIQKKRPPHFYLFDISLKEMGSSQMACTHHGLNDQKRLFNRIEESKAKDLIIITDVSELDLSMKLFLEKVGGKIKGHMPPDDFYAENLTKEINRVGRLCK